MKIVVFGTSPFAVPVLAAVAAQHDVVAVVSQPDRPAGRGHKLAASPLKAVAAERGFSVFTPTALRPFADEARGFGADAFVVASYGRIVPQALLDVVPIAFNLHPSLLPLYRGATPLQSAIRDGCSETGITVIAMDAGMDTGDVLLRERAAIADGETYGELHDRLALRGAQMIVDALAQYAVGTLERTPQSALAAHEGITAAEIAATATRPLGKDDLWIDWSAPRSRVLATVRALAPQPLARTAFADEASLKVAAMRPFDPPAGWGTRGLPSQPGPFVHAGRAAFFGGLCGDGTVVAIDRVIAPGRGAISGEAFAQSRSARAARETSAS